MIQGIRSFLIGVGSSLDMFGGCSHEHSGHFRGSRVDSWRADGRAIGGDWKKVGGDMRAALDAHPSYGNEEKVK